MLRELSNGTEETYEVIDPGFHEEFDLIPAGYQMDVKKLGRPEATNAIQSITYNVTGNNTRINQNSVDHSVNVVRTNSDVAENLETLWQEIRRLIEDDAQRSDALEIVDAIEQQFNSGTPKKPVVRTLVQGLPAAGNIASIGSLLLSFFG